MIARPKVIRNSYFSLCTCRTYEASSTVKVWYTVGPVEVEAFLVAEFVVVYSVSNSKSMVVCILKVVRSSVTFAATRVSTMICDEPWMVVEMLMLVTVVLVIVTRLVSQT